MWGHLVNYGGGRRARERGRAVSDGVSVNLNEAMERFRLIILCTDEIYSKVRGDGDERALSGVRGDRPDTAAQPAPGEPGRGCPARTSVSESDFRGILNRLMNKHYRTTSRGRGGE